MEGPERNRARGVPISRHVGQLPGARDRLPITGCQLQESLAAGRRSLFPRPPRLSRRLHLLLRTGPSPTPCRGDEEPDAAGRPSTDMTTGRPGVMRVRQWGTFHSFARPDETDAAGRPSTDLTTGRPGAMCVSQWGISFTCPTIGVHDVYIYFYGLDPPRRPARETKNLTQPGGQVRTFLQADRGRYAPVKGL